MNIFLEKAVFKTINSNIDFKENATIEIETQFSLSVEYFGETEKCIATLINETRFNEHPEIFDISLTVIGHFFCPDMPEKLSDDDARTVHTTIYDALFPYAQSMIADLTTKAGLPPLMIKKADLNLNSIETCENSANE